jgi:hypothetical protein
MSSPPSVSSSIVKGGVKAAFNIVSSVTNISISPLDEFVLDSRSITFPLTWITNSRPMFLLIQRQFSERPSSKINCVIP